MSAASGRIDPYRLLFPLGLAYAVLGAGVWVAAMLGGPGYPAELHRTLMIEGFEFCFVVGFLLTALPGLTHSRPTSRTEMLTAFAALVLFGGAALAGAFAAAHVLAFAALLTVVVAAARRLPRASQPPPEEFVYVGLGLLFGLAGTALLAAEALGGARVGPPRFAAHLLSTGMVLTLVLGVGSLLVPTFIGLRAPLEIPGIARAHERGPRRVFHAVMAAALVGAFGLELAGRAMAGARLRAAAATAIGLLARKLLRGPGRGDRSAWSMWGAGVCMLAGLWFAALAPHWAMAGHHVLFIGGFGLLTFAIATRVVISHGGHGMADEPVVLGRAVVVLLLLALAARVTAEVLPVRVMHTLALSAGLWVLACALWFRAAWPRMRHVGATLLMPKPQRRADLRPPAGGGGH